MTDKNEARYVERSDFEVLDVLCRGISKSFHLELSSCHIESYRGILSKGITFVLKNHFGVGGVAQSVECLLSNHEALNSSPTTTKKKKNHFGCNLEAGGFKISKEKLGIMSTCNLSYPGV
jgi:hypothetical protein